jgi:hypothetical protein
MLADAADEWLARDVQRLMMIRKRRPGTASGGLPGIRGLDRAMVWYALAAVVMLALLAPRPANSVLTDDEPSNDSMGTAASQIVPTAAVTTDGGEFTLTYVPGPGIDDIDYVGIGGLADGDIVTVSTTPLGDDDMFLPDTLIGLFNGSQTKKCEGDDSINNELVVPDGKGSLCRVKIDSAGTWFVGVTGASCLIDPFDGSHCAAGAYQLVVTINALVPPSSTATPTPSATSTATPSSTPTSTATPTPTPTPEPGGVLQVLSGWVGLAWLQRRRNRRVNARSRS